MITEQYISELEIELKYIEMKLHNAKCEFAAQECPHKIGDKVVINGYSNKGKEMIVDKILPTKCSWQGKWRCVGYVLKKDGSKGSLIGEVADK